MTTAESVRPAFASGAMPDFAPFPFPESAC